MKSGSLTYTTARTFDELIDSDGTPRSHAKVLTIYFYALQPDELLRLQLAYVELH